MPEQEQVPQHAITAAYERAVHTSDMAVILAAALPAIREHEHSRLELHALCDWLQMVAEGRVDPVATVTEAQGWMLSLHSALTEEGS